MTSFSQTNVTQLGLYSSFLFILAYQPLFLTMLSPLDPRTINLYLAPTFRRPVHLQLSIAFVSAPEEAQHVN